MITLKEFKRKVLRMIEEESTNPEEYTDDPDIEAKFNDVTNQVMFELARMKKIPAREVEKVKAGEYLLTDLPRFYQLDNVRLVDEGGESAEAFIFGNIVEFSTDGTATFYYYKYPERITDETVDEDYVFELSDDALEILPYGVAADLLKSDVSAMYGREYAQRFETMLARLDSRTSIGSVYIQKGES
jgi:hypothetical protein